MRVNGSLCSVIGRRKFRQQLQPSQLQTQLDSTSSHNLTNSLSVANLLGCQSQQQTSPAQAPGRTQLLAIHLSAHAVTAELHPTDRQPQACTLACISAAAIASAATAACVAVDALRAAVIGAADAQASIFAVCNCQLVLQTKNTAYVELALSARVEHLGGAAEVRKAGTTVQHLLFTQVGSMPALRSFPAHLAPDKWRRGSS